MIKGNALSVRIRPLSLIFNWKTQNTIGILTAIIVISSFHGSCSSMLPRKHLRLAGWLQIAPPIPTWPPLSQVEAPLHAANPSRPPPDWIWPLPRNFPHGVETGHQKCSSRRTLRNSRKIKIVFASLENVGTGNQKLLRKKKLAQKTPETETWKFHDLFRHRWNERFQDSVVGGGSFILNAWWEFLLVPYNVGNISCFCARKVEQIWYDNNVVASSQLLRRRCCWKNSRGGCNRWVCQRFSGHLL